MRLTECSYIISLPATAYDRDLVGDERDLALDGKGGRELVGQGGETLPRGIQKIGVGESDCIIINVTTFLMEKKPTSLNGVYNPI
jgi:hypothetical protein